MLSTAKFDKIDRLERMIERKATPVLFSAPTCLPVIWPYVLFVQEPYAMTPSTRHRPLFPPSPIFAKGRLRAAPSLAEHAATLLISILGLATLCCGPVLGGIMIAS